MIKYILSTLMYKKYFNAIFDNIYIYEKLINF